MDQPKTNNDHIAQLFTYIYTKKDAMVFLEKLTKLGDSLFSVNVDTQAKLDEMLTHPEKELLVSYAKEKQVSLEDPIQFRKLMPTLKSDIAAIPTISLVLALTPTEKMIHTLSSWFVVKLGKKCFIDISVKPEIIGGTVFSLDGVVKDYSIKKYLDDHHFNPKSSKEVSTP
jgi:hypothetical protein